MSLICQHAKKISFSSSFLPLTRTTQIPPLRILCCPKISLTHASGSNTTKLEWTLQLGWTLVPPRRRREPYCVPEVLLYAMICCVKKEREQGIKPLGWETSRDLWNLFCFFPQTPCWIFLDSILPFIFNLI